MDKYLRLGAALGLSLSDLPQEDARARLLDRLASLAREAGAPHSLQGLGVPRSQLRDLAVKAAADPCLATNPQPATVEDLERIYATAFTA